MKIPLKRVKETPHCYITHDEQYQVWQDENSWWYWAIREGNSYVVIDNDGYRTRNNCLYALSDYIQEQQKEQELWEK